MLNEIKRYNINDNLTENDLKKIGFRPSGWIPNIEEPKMNYTRKLLDDIELHIEVSLNNGKVIDFDDYKNIYVMDDKFGQPYTPFYNSDVIFPYLYKVITRYNEEMDELVSQGILKPIILNDLENQKVKKIIK